MAIFSSKRKKDSNGNANGGGNTSGREGGGATSPPVGQGSFSRSQSAAGMVGGGVQGGNSVGMMGGSSGGSPSSQQQQQQRDGMQQSPPTRYAEANAPAPGSTSTPPSGSNTVLYPWAQRRLHLLPSSLLPAPSNHPASPAAPVWGAPSSPPFPRYGHSVNPIASTPSGDLYIFGGLVANAVRNDLYVLGCTPGGAGGGGSGNAGPTGMLSVGVVETRGEVPGPRVGHASVGVGNVLIVWGGDTKSRPEDRQDDGLYLLNLSTREWTRVKTIGPNPEGRYGHAASMVGSRFFVFGGQKDDGGFMNDLVWFDLQKLKAGQPSWSFVEYTPNAVVPPKRTGHTTVTHGDCIYVFGGTDGQYHYNDTWCYDTTTQIWAELSCIGYIPVPREGHAATLVDDVMYVFGGRGVDGKDLEDLAAFKITSQRWFMFQNMGPAPSGRSGHAMATWQNKVYVLGGESYTSQRVDDPSFVHVLDTSKIKYPIDTTRQAQGQGIPRKPSLPVIMANVPSPNAPRTSNNTSPPLAGAEDAQRRAPSPIVRNGSGTFATNGQQSFGQVINQGPPTTSMNNVNASPEASIVALPAITKRSASGASSPTPLRPTRPDESPVDSESNRGRYDDSANSPTISMHPQQLSRAVSPSLTSPTGSAVGRTKGDSPASASVASLVGGAAAAGGLARIASGTRSASPAPQRTGATDVNEGSPTTTANGVVPQDAFYYGAKPATAQENVAHLEALKAKDAEIQSFKAREVWMRTALAQATRRGYVAGDAEEGSKLEELKVEGGEGGNQQVVEALMAMKQELAKAKMALSEQAHSVDERVAGASRARTNALQEASYYRAKLAALESGPAGDATKLDRERSLELEKQLAESLASKAALEKQVEELQGHVQHHSELREAAEERHTEAITRADASEGSYARSLTEYAELQRRGHAHESTIQDHSERHAALTSSHQQLLAENTHLKSSVETSHASLAQYVRTLEQTQLALVAADSRNAEVHSVWTESQEEMAGHQTRAQQLQVELDTQRVQHEAAVAKSTNLERILKAAQDDHAATKVLAAGGLAELIAAHRETSMRAVPSTELHDERIKAFEGEAATMQQLHKEVREKNDSNVTELVDVRAREVALQVQVLQLRSEVATLRGHHSKALEEHQTMRSTVAGREVALQDASRAREAAEVKANLLRNLMADHGLSVSDDELATRFPPMDGTESAEQLHRRVQDLEGRLAQQTRTHQELESNHEGAVRDLKDTDQRYQDAHRQRQASEEQLGHLTNEVERLRTNDTPEASATAERATRAEESLEALQGRHGHLEQTHLKAVQYVKGTEKMLRRMKEELTRYKERNEELETQVTAGSQDRGAHEELKTEVESLHAKMSSLHVSTSKATTDNEDLQRRISTLTNDFRLQQGSAAKTIKDLQTAVAKAHHDLEETLAVNHALNEELTSALKNPASPRTTAKGVDAGDIRLLEQELTQAQNKAEWLKRENDQLEQRCLVAEQKIGILLDHMEGADGDTYEGSSSNGHHPAQSQHAGNNFESQPAWKHSRGGSDAGSEYSERR